MAFDAYLGFSGAVATVYLSGELTERRVPALRALLEQAVTQPPNRLVVRMHDLESICVGAVRCLAFIQQQLPGGVDIVLDGPSERVRQLLRDSVFDQGVTIIREAVSFSDEAA
ncbi:STAS domain-containing protein [Streptomyces sp. CA-111067]|uniref:STAS domain-containing protein n=1 Tax=Streptomyces sp. CA-111067 TaxID=3240046 RepID=UPI003D9810D5